MRLQAAGKRRAPSRLRRFSHAKAARRVEGGREEPRASGNRAGEERSGRWKRMKAEDREAKRAQKKAGLRTKNQLK